MKKICLLIALTFFCLKGQSQTIDLKKDYLIIIETRFGTIEALLFDKTPLHKSNFINLSESGFYNQTTFHRVIPNFMIQGGDPLSKDSIPQNDGMGGPGYNIPNEINRSLKHEYGSIAAARMGDAINPAKESSGSQFYIVHNQLGTSHLDNNYTVFGKVVKGLEVLDQICSKPRDSRDRPLENIYMKVKVNKIKRKKILKRFNIPNFYQTYQ
jgi:cyclophilin family peptidyl-prolyl cis-trans isomerase